MNRLLTIVDSKYQRLEYLESTGTQYIDTGYYLQSNNLKVKAKFTYDFSVTGEKDLLGNQDFSTNRFVVGCINKKVFAHSRSGSSIDTNVVTAEYSGTQIIDLECNYDWSNNIKSITANGTTSSISYIRAISPSNNQIQLFANGNSGNLFVGKTNFIQIYDNGTLVRNYIPVLCKSDNELGMLDLVEGKFYGNAGTGKFTANLDTMYAIIQGSPTQSPYGVFSGFSSDNYLKAPVFSPQDKSYEFVCEFITGNITSSTRQGIITGLGQTDSIAPFYIYDGKLISYMSSNGTSWDICNQNTVIMDLSSNTKYKVKLEFTGSQYNWYSFENNSWTLKQTLNSAQVIYGGIEIVFGNNRGSGFYFTGTIDLNRSYIKIDDTKYKLQAVVGYTVVGSPTISDGVVSGFSSSNYLITNQVITSEIQQQYRQSFVVQVKVTLPSSFGTEQQMIHIPYRGNSSGLSIRANGNIRWYIISSNTNIIATSTFTVGTTIYIKGVISNEVATLYSSSDGVNWANEGTANLTNEGITETNTPILVGVNQNKLEAFEGSIDMNHTYIKINNKLWFNGQEA